MTTKPETEAKKKSLRNNLKIILKWIYKFFFALDVRSRADATHFKVFHILFIICLLKIFFNNIVMTVV